MQARHKSQHTHARHTYDEGKRDAAVLGPPEGHIGVGFGVVEVTAILANLAHPGARHRYRHCKRPAVVP